MPSDTTTTTTTTTSSTTTTSTTPLSPPLPADFEAVLPAAAGTVCDELRKAAEFDGLFAKFMRWMLTDDGDFSEAFVAKICALDCFAGTGTGTTGTTTLGTGTTSTTTVAKLSWALVKTLTNPRGCCISADGQVMAACEFGGNIWTSADSGATWTSRDSTRNWSNICCSSDGTKMFATVFGGMVYVSVNTGATWAALGATNGSWLKICCSDDGSKIYAAGYLEITVGNHYYEPYLLVSVDSGTTWNTVDVADGIALGVTSPPGLAIATSSDGNIVLLGYQNYIFLSLDSSDTFNNTGSILQGSAITGVAMSSNGTSFYVANVVPGHLISSTDGGVTWSNALAYGGWIDCSSDGQRLLAVSTGQRIRESFNAGVSVTFEEQARAWNGVASNPDGSKAIAIATSAGVFIGT